jgi:hypothetical protein
MADSLEGLLTQLLRESLDYFGVPSHGGDVAVPVGARSLALGAAPNPFNPATVVTYAVPRSGRVRMTVYDLRGARVRTLLDETVEAGAHELQWDGRDDGGAGVASGVYVLEMRAEEETVTRKVAVLK